MFMSTENTGYIGAVATAFADAGLPPLSSWCTPDEGFGFLAWSARQAPAWPDGLALCWHLGQGWSWSNEEAETTLGRLSGLGVDAAPADVAAAASALLSCTHTTK